MCLLESVWTCNQLFGLVISASCMKCGNQKAHIHFGARNCLHTQLHTVHAWLLYSQSCTFIRARYIFTQVHRQLHTFIGAICRAGRLQPVFVLRALLYFFLQLAPLYSKIHGCNTIPKFAACSVCLLCVVEKLCLHMQQIISHHLQKKYFCTLGINLVPTRYLVLFVWPLHQHYYPRLL